VPLFTSRRAQPARAGRGVLRLGDVFNLFVVSVFWSFMADIWDERSAAPVPIIATGRHRRCDRRARC
jgi:AAA family ATP:ADP antiporter